MELAAELTEPSATPQTKRELIRSTISILEEVCRNKNEPDFDVDQVLIPPQMVTIVPSVTVIFHDMGLDPPSLHPGYFYAHLSISPELANRLDLRRASEEEFDRVEDGIDTFHFVILELFVVRYFTAD